MEWFFPKWIVKLVINKSLLAAQNSANTILHVDENKGNPGNLLLLFIWWWQRSSLIKYYLRTIKTYCLKDRPLVFRLMHDDMKMEIFDNTNDRTTLLWKSKIFMILFALDIQLTLLLILKGPFMKNFVNDWNKYDRIIKYNNDNDMINMINKISKINMINMINKKTMIKSFR